MLRRMLFTQWMLVLMVGCALAVTACQTTGGGGEDDGPTVECTIDADCAEGEVCEDAQCVEAPEDGADGAALYADNCSACHGADGDGPPDITGMAADALSTGLESATHGAITLTEEEIAAIAEFLGG